jgi:predicted ester cyclase
MSIEKSKAIVLELYRVFDQRNIDRAFNLVSPNFVAHLAGIPNPLDSDSFKEFGMIFYSAFVDGKHQFDEIIVEGNKVVTCGTFTAKHLGEFQGLPPTGKKSNYAYRSR